MLTPASQPLTLSAMTNPDGGELGTSLEREQRIFQNRLRMFIGYIEIDLTAAVEEHDKLLPHHGNQQHFCIICSARKPQSYAYNVG